MSSGRKLPTYGKVWVDARSRGLVPVCGMFGALVLLDHWRIEHKWPFLVIAPDSEPSNLDFKALAGLDVTLAYYSLRSADERLLAAIESIMRDGARLLVTLDRDQRDRGSMHKKGER